jgi:hypothetical protein
MSRKQEPKFVAAEKIKDRREFWRPNGWGVGDIPAGEGAEKTETQGPKLASSHGRFRADFHIL